MFQSLTEVRDMTRATSKRKVSIAEFQPSWKWVPARFKFYTINKYGEEIAFIHKPEANGLTGTWESMTESMMVGEYHEKPVGNWMTCIWNREQRKSEATS